MLTGQSVAELDDIDGWTSITDHFLHMGVKNVVLTLGAKGAYYSEMIGEEEYVEAKKDIEVLDVTRAGYEYNVFSLAILLPGSNSNNLSLQ